MNSLKVSLKTAILVPLALSLIVLISGFTYALFHQKEEFTAEMAKQIADTHGVIGMAATIRDDSSRNAHAQYEVETVGGIGLLVGGFLWVGLYVVTVREERRLRASRAAVVESEERFRSLVESSSDWIWEVDADTRYVYASPKIRELLGYDPEEIVGKKPFDLMPHEEAERISQWFAGIAAERMPFFALENINQHKDGRVVVLESSGVPIFNADGTLRGYRGVDRDITDRKRAEELIKKSTRRFTLHFEQTPLAVIDWDADFRVVDWNPAAKGIFGYQKAEAMGRHAMELILPESVRPLIDKVWQDLLAVQGGFRSTNENVTQDGKLIWCEWYNTPLVDDSGAVIGVASLAQDITEQKRAEQRLNYLAYFDELTGLPNRTLFKDRLSLAITEAHRNELLVGVMFIDLDHFKIVNDTLGHQAGDWLLQAVAARLKSHFRESDTIARFGGDEFAVILADMANIEHAVNVAEKLLASFNPPFMISGNELFVTLSVGITCYPFDDNDIESLLRDADSAMYQAKAQGRDNFQFYSAEMTTQVEKRLSMETGLRKALERDEFILHYQPQFDLASNRVTGVEALVRWQHPEHGLISPAEFIPVAEESGLIIPISAWVLRTACTQAKTWQDQLEFSLKVAVNLSSRQFKHGQIAQQVMSVLEETGLDPQHLELEITESILIDNPDPVRSALADLKMAGISISLDDFGTGYSSLSYLKRFPIDKLKIDQSFVRDVMSDVDDASLVKAIIAIARSLRLRVIAEGVETQEQLDFLRNENCDEIQGFFISRPISAKALTALLQESGRAQ